MSSYSSEFLLKVLSSADWILWGSYSQWTRKMMRIFPFHSLFDFTVILLPLAHSLVLVFTVHWIKVLRWSLCWRSGHYRHRHSRSSSNSLLAQITIAKHVFWLVQTCHIHFFAGWCWPRLCFLFDSFLSLTVLWIELVVAACQYWLSLVTYLLSAIESLLASCSYPSNFTCLR